MDVAREAVTADVVDVAAEVIEPVRAAFGADRVLAHEAVVHLVREGGQLAHEAGVEQVAFGDAVADEAAADGVVGECGEDGGERLALRSRAAAPLEVHHVEKTVVDIARIGLVYEIVRDAVVYKGFDVIFHRLSENK